MASTIKAGTKVRICTFVGSRFEPHWSETGHVVSSSEPLPADGWQRVRFDADGGVLCVHRERLMVCNDQA